VLYDPLARKPTVTQKRTSVGEVHKWGVLGGEDGSSKDKMGVTGKDRGIKGKLQNTMTVVA